ncbi:arf-GAP with Rho-GAP domain, ANK repeat and PH domain-containing protein 1-like isoform X6 [Bolinopsis microptera]|uniref:arf-GAP with Rho-GAP domain, ANK repeat and PH domain-containing protein 1-like isoform X6 n=1 Tax=Bolinopsis microptera TaxID=2820187 RepID=UPI00307A725B
MHRSPTPLRASLSNTLPLPKADGIYHDSGPKSATLPNKGNSMVSALVNRFAEEPKAVVTKSASCDEQFVVRKNTGGITNLFTLTKGQVVKLIAGNLTIPIPAMLPEGARKRMIIPNRQKIEPRVVRTRRQITEHIESSDDTLDTSGEEDNKDDPHHYHGVSSPISDEVPLSRTKSSAPNQEPTPKKVRVISEQEKREKKWDTKKGWLWKQGGRFNRIDRHRDEIFHKNNKGWKKRWFVFSENKFTYYASKKHNAESLSCIALSNFKEVKIDQTEKDNSRSRFPFELITKHREYLLAAETSEERTLWCSILMIAITQYKGSILDDLLGGEMNSPDKAGLLKKQGNSRLRDWKSRYCAVKDGTFCYYESYEAYCIATPINSIYCGTLKAQISDRARFKFEVIVPNRTYYFMAQTESEMMSWIESLNKAVAAALTDLKSSGSTAKELIQRIYEEPSNAFCADCNSPDPKWASINLGVVVCIKCSGSHRDLGVHISKVRSLELDVKAWTDDMVSVFHRIGNRRANEYFEKTLDPTVYDRPAPDSDMKVREAFIEEKYTRGCWSDVITSPVEELNLELMEVVQTDQLDRTLALLMSGADVKFIDETLDHSRRTPYLMALASGQKAQAQLLLLNDADPVLPQENNEPADSDVPVDLEGILEKKGPNAIQSYKKRKCVLSGKVLKYYDDHDSFKNEIDMHKLVEVELAEAEQPDDDRNSDDYFYLRIRTDTRTFLFREKDRSYVSLWYDALKATQIFGVPIDKQPKTQNGIPVLVHKCVIFLENKIDTEGLYRISGVKTRIEKLRLLFNQNLHEVTLSDEHHVTHDVTSMMKQYFRELPVSLLGPWNQQLTEAVEIDDETERLYQIQDLIYELPATEFHTLKFVLQHLYSVAQQQSVNKMGSENLGVIFGPTLMSTHEVGSEFNPHEYQLVTTLIDYFPWIFQVNVELEESKGKELKLAEAELRKIMSNIDAPQGSVENSWIVEVFHNQNSVNIKIESGQTLRDVSAEILYRAKLADGDYALHEFLCNGQLQRPVHLSEYLLNTTVTLWEERVQRSWLAIDYNNIKEKLKIYEPPPHDSTEQGSLHMYEAKKKWREVQCKLSQDNFTYSKLKVKTNLNLLNYTWYLGCETNLSPPTHHCFTLRCVSPTRDHKDDIFKVFCAADEAEMWRWLYRINYVKFKEPDYRLVRSKRATLQNPNNRNSFILLDSRLPT